MSRSEVVIYHNVVAPYRHALFAALARRMRLQVWYAMERSQDRAWETVRPPTYQSELLDARAVYRYGRPLMWSPRLGARVREQRPRILIATLAAASTLDVLRLAKVCKTEAIAFVPWVGDTERGAASGDPVPKLVRRFFDAAAQAILQRADGLLCYSERSRVWAWRRGARGPVAVGTQAFEPPQLAPRVNVHHAGARYRLLYVGKLESRKGVDVLTEALLQIPQELRGQVDIEIIGDGPLEVCVNSLREAGGAVYHRRALFGAALQERMRDADLLVVPSRHDPWGNVINEAMALGTPVLASLAAGGAELAREAGWTTEAGNPKALAEMLGVAIPESRRPDIRKRAVASVARYSTEAVADRIIGLIDDLTWAHP